MEPQIGLILSISKAQTINREGIIRTEETKGDTKWPEEKSVNLLSLSLSAAWLPYLSL